ncbi:urease accessory protein UreD [Aspergillus saccharolyticus JOP 1030-1]|uniref:UreD-domain-containing protein n=1 Tax=Aspergillus saccharolyticus JOP 1030-1 TaxID=1450539 RepID=A0A318ZHG1_9EURO|nr:UreD-domain-containing protein [Aspergillus saccharolyticus JOP 1030-1]PYH44003.1 UreD-domain-containing protein [Aspergillus saccharolyticus JOP 1030-1]
MPIKSPFESSIAKPGEGKVVLSLLPPSNPTLTTLTYKYPLKLLTRTPGFVPKSSALTCPSQPVHLYLLTYGGGLLPGDKINVSITLEPRTRMVVTTPQGSTKIFKTEPNASVKGQRGTPKPLLSDKSSQTLNVHVGQEAALCYLPDPAVPYQDSRYEQVQTFTVEGSTSSNDNPRRSSLCILDWVTQGRASRGEAWDFHLWRGKNEVWTTTEESGKRKLLLRDSLILDRELDEAQLERGDPELLKHTNVIRERTHPHGVVGTLILYGPVFERLATFFMDRFTSLPRIGARNWSSSPAVASGSAATEPTPNFDAQVTFTAARVRAGFVLVKFGAPDFAAAKDWLGAILRDEGSVYAEFGEEALFCL